jgi:hypothetical protein
MWQNILGHCAVFTKVSEEFAPHYLAEIRHDMRQTTNASIFTFSNQYDIDGNVLGNTARYINHSCAPNCAVDITRRRIWIVAIRVILAGEELSYNYGYGMEQYGDFPCTCKATHCMGYILAEEYWGLIKKKDTFPRNTNSA